MESVGGVRGVEKETLISTYRNDDLCWTMVHV